jgi:dimethylargininase
MWIAVTREVSPALGSCELSYIPRDAIDLARAREQHGDYQQVLEALG